MSLIEFLNFLHTYDEICVGIATICNKNELLNLKDQNFCQILGVVIISGLVMCCQGNILNSSLQIGSR